MGDKVELTLEDREVTGKKVARLRREGFVPAVVYGQDMTAQSVMAPSIPLTKVYRAAGKRQPVELTVGKQKRLAMIKSADIDPVKHQLRHVAFHVVKQNEKVQTEVPLVIDGAGETPAEKAGLVVLTTLDAIQLEAFPKDLPDSVHVDGEKFAEIGDHVTVADLVALPGVTILTEPEQVLATVYEPSALAAQNEAAGGEAEGETPDEEGAESTEGEGEENPEAAEEGKEAPAAS